MQANAPSVRPRAPWWRRLGYALVPLIAAVAFVEGVGRAVDDAGCSHADTLLRYARAHPAPSVAAGMAASVPMPADPLLGWTNLPGYAGPNLGATVRHNALGLRGPDVALRKADGVRRVVVVGDSTIYGHGVEESETFARVLEARLRARGIAVEVINGGTPAYSSLQTLRQARHVLAPLAPDVVVIGNMWSDSMPSEQEDAAWLIGNGSAARAREAFLRADRALSRVSAAWCAVRDTPPEVRADSTDFARVAQPSAAPKDLPGRRVPPEAYRRNLEDMAGWARAQGAAPVYLALGHPADRGGSLQGIGSRHRANIEAYRGAMRAAAVAQKAPLADGAPAFGAAREAQQLRLFVDSIHPSPQGHAILAEVLEATLLASEEARRALGLEAGTPVEGGP